MYSLDCYFCVIDLSNTYTVQEASSHILFLIHSLRNYTCIISRLKRKSRLCQCKKNVHSQTKTQDACVNFFIFVVLLPCYLFTLIQFYYMVCGSTVKWFYCISSDGSCRSSTFIWVLFGTFIFLLRLKVLPKGCRHTYFF